MLKRFDIDDQGNVTPKPPGAPGSSKRPAIVPPQRECQECEGSGVVYDPDDKEGWREIDCEICNGRGVVD